MTDITVTHSHPTRRVRKNALLMLVREIIRNEKVSRNVHFDYILVDDRFMRSLNRKYFRKRTTTDVIAFDLSGESAREIEGEIYINLDQAAKQAGENGVSFSDEIFRLAAHGCLHFLGYDDHGAADRKKMLDRGEYYLKRINLS